MKVKSTYIATTSISNDELLYRFQNTPNARFMAYRGDAISTSRYNPTIKMEIEHIWEYEYNCFSHLGVGFFGVFGTVIYYESSDKAKLELTFRTGSFPLFGYLFFSVVGMIPTILYLISRKEFGLLLPIIGGVIGLIFLLVTIVNYHTSLKHKKNLEEIIGCVFQ